ncbi:MAG: RNA polymerase sigma factor [Mobilitalea sp.]
MGNIQKNQMEFMEEICADTWKELYRFVYYKVQNREEAEDITQESYIRAISYINRNDDKVIEYGSYLKAISMNIIRDQCRLTKRRGKTINIEEVNPEEYAEGDFADAVSDRAMIEKALECLTVEQQKVITLRIIKGYSVADTAKLMQKNQNTVRVLQFRAIKALSKIFDLASLKGGI